MEGNRRRERERRKRERERQRRKREKKKILGQHEQLEEFERVPKDCQKTEAKVD